ncbi:thyroid hormone receptor-associated protein,putative, partial [Schistosoma mansoni]
LLSEVLKVGIRKPLIYFEVNTTRITFVITSLMIKSLKNPRPDKY